MKCSQPSQAEVRPPDQRFRGKLEIRHSFKQCFEGGLAFNPCQSRPETEMSGPPKRKMPVIFPRDVKSIGIRETLGVAVAGGHNRDGCLTLLNLLSTELEILRSNTSRVLAGGLEPQHLFHRGGNEREVGL